MAKIYLVRHGQASFEADNYDELSALGYEQSSAVGAFFKDQGVCFDEFWCGTLNRHQQTLAKIIFELELVEKPEVNLTADLNEYDFKKIIKNYIELNNLSNTYNKKEYISLLRSSLSAWQDAELIIPSNETWIDFTQRLVKFCTEQKDKHKSQKNILVVASGGSCSAIIQNILDLKNDKFIDLNIQTANCAITEIYFNEKNMWLSGFNNLIHLGKNLITYI